MTRNPSDKADRAAAEAALALEILRGFFAQQIDAGAVEREEVARQIDAAAARLTEGERDRKFTTYVTRAAHNFAATLPAGWAEGDSDWQEPA